MLKSCGFPSRHSNRRGAGPFFVCQIISLHKLLLFKSNPILCPLTLETCIAIVGQEASVQVESICCVQSGENGCKEIKPNPSRTPKLLRRPSCPVFVAFETIIVFAQYSFSFLLPISVVNIVAYDVRLPRG